MITVVTLAVVVPGLLAVASLGLSRIGSTPLFRSLAHARSSDARGVALQTVIIIVVLLAIAGAVAGVLLSRAGDVTGELQSADVTATRIDTRAECENHEMGGRDGIWSSPQCTWTSTTPNDPNAADVTSGRCALVGGTFTPGEAAPGNVTAKCVVG